MKKYRIILMTTLFLVIAGSTATAQENHGDVINIFVKFGENSGASANYEFQVHPDITVSPEVRFWFDGGLAIGARGDYYFDRIFNLKEPWDIWGGVDAGFVIDRDDDFSINLHAGGEYKFNETWGLILEIGGGTAASGGLGVGIHF